LSRRESARSDFEARRSFLPRRASAARSRFDCRDSLRDTAVSRPRFEAFEGAAFAALFLAADFFDAAEAVCGLKRNREATASATRQGNRNFRVIEPSSLKNQAEVVAACAVLKGGVRGGGRV
jgi:hypothetical protein